MPRKKRPDVGLDTYRTELHAKVEEFAEMWRKSHERDPENWPLQYPDKPITSATEAWDERFRAWMGWDD